MAEGVTVLSWREAVSSLLPEWKDLGHDLGAAPDLRPEWFQALIEVHAIAESNVSVLAGSDENGLAMLCPFYTQRQSASHLFGRLLQPLTNLHCFHNSMLSRLDETRLRETYFEFTLKAAQWDVMQINNVAVDDPLARICQGLAAKAGFSCRIVAGESPPYLTIGCSWQEFLAAKSSNFRYNLKRKRRKLESKGELTIEFFDTAEDFSRVFDEICDIERRSWKHDAGSAITSRAWEERFYKIVLPRLLADRMLLVTVLRVAGEPVAHDISAISGGKAYCMKTSFDAKYSMLSPGITLRAVLLEKIFDDGAIEYDFLGAGEQYKLGWGTGVRDSVDITLFNRTTRGLVASLRSQISSRLRSKPEES